VRDLATVQGLASQLLSFDPVTFLSKLEGLRLSEAGSSIWLYHEATHVIYEQVVTVAKLTASLTTFIVKSMWQP